MSLHCKAPDRCSVCCGWQPRRVALDAGQVTVDGVAVRQGEAPASGQRTASQRRGGRTSRKAKK